MATKNIPVMNLAIIMFYNPQNASFMHISSPVNAIEDNYVTLGYFVKSKMANSRFILEIPYFSRFAFFFFFSFLKAQTFIFQKMVGVSTNLSGTVILLYFQFTFY